MRAPTEILGIRYFLLGVIFTRTDTRVESSHQGTPQNKNKSFSFHFQTARAFGPGLLILLYGLPAPLGRTTTYYHILLRRFRLLVPSRPGLISYRIRVQLPLYPVYSGKGALRWRGPYAIVARRPSSTYVLQELDGAVLRQLITGKQLKSYMPRQGLEPAILPSECISCISEIEEDLLKNNSDELQVLMVHVNRGHMDVPSLPKPWLLKDEEANEYWRGVYQKWIDRREKQKARIQVEPKLEISLEMQKLIEEDKQYWNYREVIPNQEGKLPHWNSHGP